MNDTDNDAIDTGTQLSPHDDRTRLQPPSGGAPEPKPHAADDDSTRLAPITPRGRARSRAPLDDATRLNTPPRSDDSAGASSWKRVSQLRGDPEVGVGMLLKGRFLLVREIGRGGMGVVYLARDERKVEAHDRNPYIAVKVLNDEFRRHPDSLIALQRESRRAQSLAHDHIVRVYDFDKDGAIVFMTMEYIEGSDLRGLIRSRMGEGLPLVEAWPLIEGMGRALQRAHAAGIVHSDFKPGNVMVGAGHVAKVFDFGIARAAKLAGGESGDDQTLFDAATLGAMTPAYASLAMLRGEEPSFADDVYAFGCVVYELLSGRHPFAKQSAEQAQANDLRAPPLRGLSRRQNRGLLRSLSFDAGDRPAMATLIELLRPRTRAERLLPYVLFCVLLLAGGIGIAAWIQAHAHRQQVAGVLERFSAHAPDRFAHEDQARAALSSLDEDDRRRLILDRSNTIEAFLLTRLDHYWQPAEGREDYAAARRILALRDQWKLFSPELDARRAAMELERDRLLNELDTQLDDAIAAGALFEDQPGNVVTVLGRVRRLAPDSGLLRHPELELKYERGLADALAEGRTDDARRWLVAGRLAFPHSPLLAARRRELEAAAPALPSAPRDAETQVAAEIAARIESVRAAAAANDVTKIKDLLARVAAAQPDHPFLRGEGAERLTDAYLGHARALCREGRWKEAAAVARLGLGEQDAPRLRHALDRYELAMALETLGRGTPSPAELQRLRERKATLQSRDAEGFRAFERDVARAGRQRSSVAATLLPKLQQAPPAPALPTSNSDPCRVPASPGGVATCRDGLGDHGQGPELVVLPGPGRRLAMMRREVSVADFALFCGDTRRCSVSRFARRSAAVDDVRLALFREYAAWLSKVSGRRYRLPSDAEWLRAARAGEGGEACPSTAANRWGLIDIVGGVGEWVLDGDAVAVRGGARHPAACAEAGAQAASGDAVRGIGARLVRELE